MNAVALRSGGLRPLSIYRKGVRSTPMLTGSTYQPNAFDACLSREFALWHQLTAIGLDKLCCPAGRRPYEDRPWVKMPDGGREFSQIGILAVSAITPGVDTTVFSELVPYGYDGVVNYAICTIQQPAAGGGTGFGEGSGQITWKLKANERHLRDFGQVLVQRGSLIDPSPIPNAGLRVYSRNLLQWTVNIVNGSGLNPNANIICSALGWFYPR
jgi:hypothetical protein